MRLNSRISQSHFRHQKFLKISQEFRGLGEIYFIASIKHQSRFYKKVEVLQTAEREGVNRRSATSLKLSTLYL